MTTVYVSIGNSDDKLPQKRWAEFVRKVDSAARHYGPDVHGFWLSAADSPYQNACWCVEANDHVQWSLAERLTSWRAELVALAREFGQDSIKWDVVDDPEFLRASLVDDVVRVWRHASPNCACGTNEAGEVYVDPICWSGRRPVEATQ